jgi:hypothetical protein
MRPDPFRTLVHHCGDLGGESAAPGVAVQALRTRC